MGAGGYLANWTPTDSFLFICQDRPTYPSFKILRPFVCWHSLEEPIALFIDQVTTSTSSVYKGKVRYNGFYYIKVYFCLVSVRGFEGNQVTGGA